MKVNYTENSLVRDGKIISTSNEVIVKAPVAFAAIGGGQLGTNMGLITGPDNLVEQIIEGNANCCKYEKIWGTWSINSVITPTHPEKTYDMNLNYKIKCEEEGLGQNPPCPDKSLDCDEFRMGYVCKSRTTSTPMNIHKQKCVCEESMYGYTISIPWTKERMTVIMHSIMDDLKYLCECPSG